MNLLLVAVSFCLIIDSAGADGICNPDTNIADDRPGWDFMLVPNVPDDKACCYNCSGTPTCRAFAYISEESPKFPKTCWLKVKVPPVKVGFKEYHKYLTSGVMQECSGQDILFILDGSGSVREEGFKNILKFVNLIVSELEFGANLTNIGIIQFASEAVTEFPLTEFSSRDEAHEAVNKIKWLYGGTKIGLALQYALDNVLNKEPGDRPTAPDVVITLTDGLSSDNPRPPAEEMRNQGISTYAIGVTEQVSDRQLLNIAGDASRVFKVSSFDSLDENLKQLLVQQICVPYPVEIPKKKEEDDSGSAA